jgi:ketosteroid isomerase-like protein
MRETIMVDDANSEQEVREAERARCDFLMRGDVDKLSALMADDLVHIHGNGHIDDKAGYLAGVADKFRFHDVERHDLRVRVYGAVAVMTGRLTQTVVVRATNESHPIQAVTTQTWNRTDHGWLQSTCHNAFLPRS